MPLQENQRYAIDGGLFRAVYDEEEERFQRWTHEGHSGRVIARTGIDIDAAGTLDQRLFAFARSTQLLIAAAG